MPLDIEKICLDLNDAYMSNDVEWLTRLIHPNFKRKDTQAQFVYDRASYFESAKQIKERYGVYYFKLIGCDILSESSALYMTYFYGHDSVLSQPSERIYCVLSEFQDNQFINDHLLCHPPFNLGNKNEFDSITIEHNLRKKLYAILKITNFRKIVFSARELDCVFFYLIGKSYQEIADKLSISSKTVDAHLRNARIKCKVETLKELKSLFKLSP
jgi:DNA-binding CsgD family transcriptional regulator